VLRGRSSAGGRRRSSAPAPAVDRHSKARRRGHRKKGLLGEGPGAGGGGGGGLGTAVPPAICFQGVKTDRPSHNRDLTDQGAAEKTARPGLSRQASRELSILQDTHRSARAPRFSPLKRCLWAHFRFRHGAAASIIARGGGNCRPRLLSCCWRRRDPSSFMFPNAIQNMPTAGMTIRSTSRGFGNCKAGRTMADHNPTTALSSKTGRCFEGFFQIAPAC